MRFTSTLCFTLACSTAAMAGGARPPTHRFPPQAVGNAASYQIQGSGEGTIGPSPDLGAPLELITSVTIQRSVLSVKEGITTAEQRVTQQSVEINGHKLAENLPPTVRVTTDAAGHVVQAVSQGSEAPTGPANLQSVLALWQFPERDLQPGQSWDETVPLTAQDAAGKPAAAAFRMTYVGPKRVSGRDYLQITSHLLSPVTLRPTGAPVLGGFTPTSLTIGALEQASYFDSATGKLSYADTQITLDSQVQMGQQFPLEMAAHLPVTLHTVLLKANGADAARSPTP